jgi:hypothetical protein
MEDSTMRRTRWLSRAAIAIILVVGATALLGSTAMAGPPWINLTTAGASIAYNAAASGGVGSALYVQGGSGAGTGQFDPFLTLSANTDTERGYNTAGTTEFDTFTGGGRTHALQAAAIPPVTIAGTVYREFSLDANDTGSDDWMSIDAVKIFLDSQSDLTGFNTGTNSFSSDDSTKATLIYDQGTGTVLMRSQTLTPGSGVSDITIFVPDSLFPASCFYGSLTCGQWVYFYTENGNLGVSTAGGTTTEQNYNVTGGFEEWRTRLLPVVNVAKTVTLTRTRTFDWTLTKQVSIDNGATWQSADSVNLFNGQSQDYKWKLTWTKDAGTISNPQISGSITVTNPTGGTVISTGIDAVVNSVTDTLVMGATTHPTVTCPVTFPHTLKAQESIICTYTAAGSTTDGTNTATANITNGTGTLDYSSAAMPVTWANATTTDVDGTASINDPNFTGANQTGLTANGSFTSTAQTFTCGTTTTLTNTATLTESTSSQTRVSTATFSPTCYGLTVTKTAATTFTRTFDWTLNKEISIDGGSTWQKADSVSLFNGQSQDYLWRLTWTKNAGTDSAWNVTGNIVVTNPAPMVTPTVTVTDSLSIDGAATVTCPDTTVAANSSMTCTYTKAVASAAGQTNTGTATMVGIAYTGTATVTFSSTPTTLVDNSASISDPNFTAANQTGLTASGSSTSTTQTFTCGTSTTITNTATLTEGTNTNQTHSSSATLTPTCYGLTVTKTAATTFTRTYSWTISKTSSDGATLTLQPNETFDYHYSVTVNATFADSAWNVTGNIVITNPAPIATPTVTVADALSLDGAATVTCPATTIAASSSMTCTYTKALTSATSQTNTATATIVAHDYTGTAPVTFGSPSSSIDECISVDDTLGGVLGTACYGADTLPKTFNYTLTYGPFGADCGDHTIPNTATFTTNDTSTQNTSTWTLVITVPCPVGCTLTQGYWKTHSVYGPAKHTDATWTAASGSSWDTGFNQDSLFYSSGQSYYSVLWTAPKGGNAYYILAHQYIAALLNIRSGAATTPAVVTALNFAQTFFTSNSPTTNLSKTVRQDAVSAAGTLGSYNEGLIGPGHCSQDTTAQTADHD